MTPTAIDLLTVREAAEQRRSIRVYEAGPIPRGDLVAILDVVRRAPSAFNVQPWRFVVVESPDLKEQLAAAAYNQRQVHSAPAVIVLYTDMDDTLATLEEILHPGMNAAARAATCETILKMFGSQSVDEREAWAATQGYIALGYLLLAAEAHGYQTSPMTGFAPNAVKTVLDLPENARVTALVAIGKGAEAGFPQHRHDVDRLLRVA